jgi:plastocyanin
MKTSDPRTATVGNGDTIDFQTAPFAFHVIALAKDEASARQNFPLAGVDADDGTNPNRSPRVQLGPAFFTPTTCGLVGSGQAPCTFDGNNMAFAGGIGAGPTPVDWQVTITAPPGPYVFFCYIHPGMRGNLTVVSPGGGVPIDSGAAETQFQNDQAAGLTAESNANHLGFDNGKAVVNVGTADADKRVAVDEMLPQNALIPKGAGIEWKWIDSHNVHTVTGPAFDSRLPDDFGFDCAQGYVNVGQVFRNAHTRRAPCHETGEPPELIADPGQAPGLAVQNTKQIFDSGTLLGPDFNFSNPTAWSLTTTNTTVIGHYAYQCRVHPFMVGHFDVVNFTG